ncbi:hypothetical protein LVJ94_13125 [Pendulispora rubella]|uniref:Uncharacterized protein n=1 Tax=Pendulispora rubella TaxID=2741070 RepID=A0ABZ2LH92_9BACT
MKTKLDARLLQEAEHFAFRFACEDCVHFDPGSPDAPARCAHGYPPGPRRDQLEIARGEITFCKEFELR